MDSAGGEPKSSRRFFGDAGELAPSPLLARGEKRVALPCLARARLASYCRFGRFPWAWPGRALSSVRCGPHSERRQPNGPLSSRAGQAWPNAGNQTRPKSRSVSGDVPAISNDPCPKTLGRDQPRSCNCQARTWCVLHARSHACRMSIV